MITWSIHEYHTYITEYINLCKIITVPSFLITILQGIIFYLWILACWWANISWNTIIFILCLTKYKFISTFCKYCLTPIIITNIKCHLLFWTFRNTLITLILINILISCNILTITLISTYIFSIIINIISSTSIITHICIICTKINIWLYCIIKLIIIFHLWTLFNSL